MSGMNLILELMGPAPSPASVRRKVFGTDGGRIGRAVDCDWVLASPYISRHHATVGEGAQLAGAALVHADVPPGARWGGTPAKPVKA